MSVKPLSNDEIKRRKKIQARTSQVTGTLGLAALGGTALATRSGQKVLAAGFKRAGKPVPQHLTSQPKPKGLDRTITPMLATSAGIGSLGSFNFARYTRAEADKGKKVKKNFYGGVDDFPVNGEFGKAEYYNPEQKRMKRAKNYENALMAGAGAGGAGAGLKAAEAYKGSKNLRPVEVAPVSNFSDKQGKPKRIVSVEPDKAVKAIPTANLKPVGSAAGKAVLLGTAATGAALGSRKINRSRKEGSWSPYVAKSRSSAFGVVHD